MANEVHLDKVCPSVFGFTAMRYRQLAKEGIAPPVVKGQIDFVRASKAIIDYYRKLAEGGGGLSLTDQRTRLTKINADKKELELEMSRGNLIKTEAAQKLWGAVMQNVVNRLDAMSSKVAPRVHGLSIPEAKAEIDKSINEVKGEIANPDLGEIARMASHKRPSKPGPSKAVSKGKRVGGSKSDAKSGGKRGARKVVHVKG